MTSHTGGSSSHNVSSTATHGEPSPVGRPWLTGVGWVLLAGLVLVQLYGVYWPREPAPTTFAMEDKLVHAAVFGAPVAVSVALRLRPRVVVPLVAANAIVSELVQGYFLSGRDGDVWDVTADLVGVALGLLAGLMLRGSRSTRR